MRLEDLTVITAVKSVVFWDVVLCSLIEMHYWCMWWLENTTCCCWQPFIPTPHSVWLPFHRLLDIVPLPFLHSLSFFTLSSFNKVPSFVLWGSTILGMVNNRMGGLLRSPHAAGLQLGTQSFCVVAFLQVCGGVISTFTSSFTAWDAWVHMQGALLDALWPPSKNLHYSISFLPFDISCTYLYSPIFPSSSPTGFFTCMTLTWPFRLWNYFLTSFPHWYVSPFQLSPWMYGPHIPPSPITHWFPLCYSLTFSS